MAAQHLLSKGHRRIVIMQGLSHSHDNALRIQGFMSVLEKSGVEVETTVLNGNYNEVGAAYATGEFYRQPGARRFTAFFCCNDLMAYGVMAKLREVGLQCPRDVSVVGYDDDPRSATADPPLSTVRTPVYDMVRQGVGKLLAHLPARGVAPGAAPLPAMKGS